MSDGEHGGGSDWRRRFLASSSSAKSNSKAKNRDRSASSSTPVRSATSRMLSSHSSRSNLVIATSPKAANSDVSDQDEMGDETSAVRSPGSTAGGARHNLLRLGRSRTDSIREDDEDRLSGRLAKSPSDHSLNGERVRTAAEQPNAQGARKLSAGKLSPQTHTSTQGSTDGDSGDDGGDREGKRGSVIEKVAQRAKLAFPSRKIKESGMAEIPQSPLGKAQAVSSKHLSSRTEARPQDRRPSADQGQVSGARIDGPSPSPAAVNKHKKLPIPVVLRTSDSQSPSGADEVSKNASAHRDSPSPVGVMRPTTVPPRSTSNDVLHKSQETQAVKPGTVKKSNKIIDFSAADLRLTEVGNESNSNALPLNSPSMLTKPNIETKRKPSMNSIKEGIEPPTTAGDGTSKGPNLDPRHPAMPNNVRSASAMKVNSISNPSSCNLVVSKPSSNPAPQRQKKAPTFEPPMPEPETDSDVKPAPPSGMYWSKAPCFGYDHNALRAHTATLVGSNIYIFGGCDSHTCFNDLYIFDADCMYWTSPECTGEVPPALRAMTATAVGKKIIIFGGGDGPVYYNDVFVLDTLTLRYTKPKVAGAMPSKRRAHTACLYKHGIYVFGGGDGVKALNDIWRLDVSDTSKMAWKLISASSKSAGRPTARGYHTSNMVGSKLIIFGGSDGIECFRDVWVFDVETHVWRAVEIKVSFPRLSHTATVIGSYLFVIGGHDGVEYSSDVLLLNLVTMQWDKRTVYGMPPSGRGYHGTVLHDSRLFVIGGFDGTTVFDDTYLLELAVNAYYSQISHFTVDV